MTSHGAAKFQAIQIVVNEAVKLLSEKMDDKMQATDVMAINTMLLKWIRKFSWQKLSCIHAQFVEKEFGQRTIFYLLRFPPARRYV